jgi:hypothetical protein
MNEMTEGLGLADAALALSALLSARSRNSG